MKLFMADRTLMRVKDLLLILMALASALSWANRFVSMNSEIPDLRAKVDRHELQIAVVNAQYTEIIRRLERIEKR